MTDQEKQVLEEVSKQIVETIEGGRMMVVISVKDDILSVHLMNASEIEGFEMLRQSLAGAIEQSHGSSFLHEVH